MISTDMVLALSNNATLRSLGDSGVILMVDSWLLNFAIAGVIFIFVKKYSPFESYLNYVLLLMLFTAELTNSSHDLMECIYQIG